MHIMSAIIEALQMFVISTLKMMMDMPLTGMNKYSSDPQNLMRAVICGQKSMMVKDYDNVLPCIICMHNVTL